MQEHDIFPVFILNVFKQNTGCEYWNIQFESPFPIKLEPVEYSWDYAAIKI